MMYKEQRVLWKEISRLVSQELPSLITRDFNCIMGSHKKRDSRQYVNSMESKESGSLSVMRA